MSDFFETDGASLRVLSGQDNYSAWSRDFKVVATGKGVFKLYTGEMPVLEKPDKDTYLHPSGAVTTRKKSDEFDFAAAVAEYRIDLDEYKDNAKLVREALSLLARWVDPAIRGTIIAFVTPKEAWDFLKDQYKMTDRRALDLLRTRLESTKLSSFKTVTQYLNALQELKLDMTEAGGTLTDEEMVSKILRGLPARYDPFVDSHYQLVDTPGLDDGGLKGLTARLITFEARLQQRQSQKSSTGNNNNKTKDTGDDKEQEGGGRRRRVKCSYEPCGKWGHEEKNCYMKNPDLKPKQDNKDDWKNKSNNDNNESKQAWGNGQKSEDKPKKFTAMASVNNLGEFKRRLAQAEAEMRDVSSMGSETADRMRSLQAVEAREGAKKAMRQEREDMKLLRQEKKREVETALIQTAKKTQGWEDSNTPGVMLFKPKHQSESTDPIVIPDDSETHSQGQQTDTPEHLGTPQSPPTHPPLADRATQDDLFHSEGRSGDGGSQVKASGVPVDRIPLRVLRDGNDFSLRHLAQKPDTHVRSFLISGADSVDKDDWIADSGANAHIANSIKWFQSVHAINMDVDTADEKTSLHIVGGGRVSLLLKNIDGDVCELELSEVAFAPDSKCNLLSMSSLFDKGGFNGKWGRDLTIETSDGYKVGVAELREGLYHLALAEIPTVPSDERGGTKFAALIDYDDPVWKWHRRLGHLSIENIRRLVKQSTGIDLTDKQLRAKLKAICPVCATTRATVRIPRDPADRRFESVGDLLHVDTWGPYPIEGKDGEKYAIFFTDDATRYTFVDFFTSKDEIGGIFRTIHRRIERTHDCKIKRYRFDNEFVRIGVTDWLEKHGVSIEPSAPYQHHQNGVAERANRTVRDRASAISQEPTISGKIREIIAGRGKEMLRECTIPENLWPEAIRHATYLKNRSPTKAHKNRKTAWEALHGIKPYLGREIIWGSRAYVTIPMDDPHRAGPKLHTPRGWLGYAVGCEGESIYRIWRPEEHTVYRISMARVEQGEGLDDPQDGPALRDREKVSSPVQEPQSEHSADGRVQRRQGSESETGNVSDHPQEAESTTNIQDDPANGPFYDDSDVEFEPDDVFVSDDELDDQPPTSRFDRFRYGAIHLAAKRKRPVVDSDLHGEEEVCSDADDSESGSDAPSGVRKDGRKLWNDGTRCDLCIRQIGKCDGQRPCSACQRKGRICRDPRPETIAMIPKHMRNVQKALPPPIVDERVGDQKCRQCYLAGTRCIFLQADGKCDRCTRHKRACTMDLTGAEEDRYKKNRKPQKEAPVSKGVPMNEKCDQCRGNLRKCDGAKPCSTCVGRGHGSKCRYTPPELKDALKCTKCQFRECACDRQRPCGSCVARGEFACTYHDQEGLVDRQYFISSDDTRRILASLSESEDECMRCQWLNKGCNGEKPCWRCATVDAVCSYNRTGRLREKWNAKYYEASYDEKDYLAVLKDGWQDAVAADALRRSATTKTNIHDKSKAKASTGQSDSGFSSDEGPSDCDDVDIDLNDHNVPDEALRAGMTVSQWKEHKAIQARLQRDQELDTQIERQDGSKPQRARSASVESHFKETNRSPDFRARDLARSLTTNFPDAQTAYTATFPRGHDVIPTSGAGLLCGLRAVANTMAAMYPGLPRPTVQDLQNVRENPEYRQFLAQFQADPVNIDDDFGLDNDNNFLADQVGAMLGFWADAYHDMHLQVGIVRDDQPPFLLPYQGSTTPLIIWIHNAPGHFSGIRPRTLPDNTANSELSLEPDLSKDSDVTDSSSDEGEPPVDEDITSATPAANKGLKRRVRGGNRGKSQALVAKARRVDPSRVADPRSYKEAMRSADAEMWKVAIGDEYHSLESNDTWEIMKLPDSRTPLWCKWTFKRKYGPQGEVKRYKARLCARGDQQKEGIDFKETYSAVVKSASYKVLFAIQALFDLQCDQMDVVTAFLNGELGEEVFMRPPEGFPQPSGMVLRLKKALYGLRQSPRVWYGKFTREMKQMGFRVSVCDPCVFIHDGAGVIVAIWVDDLLLFGKDEAEIRGIKAKLSATFKMTDEGACSFYLGMHVTKDSDGVMLHQEAYAYQVLDRFGLRQAPEAQHPTDGSTKNLRANTQAQTSPAFRLDYQSRVGSLMWESQVSRPDIAFVTNLCARFNANPSQAHMDAVNGIYAYLKATPTLGLHFRAGESQPLLVGYVDSDYAGCLDTRRSTTGWIFMLGGSPVSWCSQRQKTVSTSTLEAEYVAAAEATKEAVWLRTFINDLGITGLHIDTVPLHIDNNSALLATRNPDFNGRMKHIDVRHHFIREKVEEGVIDTIRVASKDNLADILTKPLDLVDFERLTTRMGLGKAISQMAGGD